MWVGGHETRKGPRKGGKEVIREGVGRAIAYMRQGSGRGENWLWKGKVESKEMRGRSRRRGSSKVCMQCCEKTCCFICGFKK